MKNSISILVVDDDNAHRTMLRTLLTEWGYTVFEADDGSTAVSSVQKSFFDMILMDIRMLKISGLEALDSIKALNPAIPVIIMTAYSSIETAVSAIKKGAYDYLTKPLDFEKLKSTIEMSVEHRKIGGMRHSIEERYLNREKIIGSSLGMTRLLNVVAKVAPSEATVLINGESGTGKELIAEAIHYNSHRNGNPFIRINCAAITDTLLESELFGHEKGSFTGADRIRDGLFSQGDSGSIFLDEVSEMSLNMQVKLLRALQEREITRVGGDNVIKIDIRIIAATNKDLVPIIEKGLFREDLYYRLNVVNLKIPPLRERKEDIPVLAEHFMKIFAEKNHKKIKGFTPEAMDHLIRYDWSGNVRELMNAVERGTVYAQREYLDTDDLFMGYRSLSNKLNIRGSSDYTEDVPLEEVEKATILKVFESTGGNKSQTARKLGITRRTLYKKLKKYNVID
jgi:two-component system response regulator HydG